MSLIERYVYAVTKHLPQSQRDDVAEELRASIEDMASDRAKKGKPTESDVTKVLEELGDPAILAKKYGDQKRYLIGPKWYDAYICVLKQLMLIVPPIVLALMLVVNFVNNYDTSSIAKIIIDSIGHAANVAIQTAFWITLTFVFVERATDAYPPDSKNKAWTVDQLEQLAQPPKKRQIGLVESITSAALTAVGTLLIAFTPIVHQVLNPELWNVWMPVFFVLAGLSLIHKLFQVKIGSWTTPLVITNILLGIAGSIYLVALVTTTQIVNIDFFSTLPISNGASVEKISEWINWSVGISTLAFVGTFVWEMIESVRLNRQLKK